MRVFLGFVLCLVALAAGAFALIYSGVYNVAATQPHYPVVYWVLDTTMHNSVKAHATDIVVPARFSEEQRRNGFSHFRETCVQCHGAPGVEPGEVGKGLRPDPPMLSEAVGKWTTAEQFWIVKHGIKMAGMPAFGPTHSDEEIWEIAAFLDRLPTLTPEEYARMAAELGGHGQGDPPSGGRHGHDEQQPSQ